MEGPTSKRRTSGSGSNFASVREMERMGSGRNLRGIQEEDEEGEMEGEGMRRSEGGEMGEGSSQVCVGGGVCAGCVCVCV